MAQALLGGERQMKLARILSRLSPVFLSVLMGCTQNSTVMIANVPPPIVDTDIASVSFPTNAPQLSSIMVQDVQPRTVALEHVTGRLYLDDDVTVRVFTPVAGRVVGIRSDLGDSVTNGSPLASIDSPDFGQALANARTAIGNLAAADKAFQRSKEMLAHGAAAQRDVEAAEAAYVAALAERDRAQAVLANYRGSDASTNSIYVLRSPIAGVVVDKSINPGQELRADLMLANAPNLFAPNFVISDPTKLWLQLDVAESDLTAMRKGQALRVYSDAFPGRQFDGTVESVGETLDPNTRTLRVRGFVNNPDNLLKAEMYVLADVVETPDQTAQLGVQVPAGALFMKGNDSYLFVEQAPGKFLRRQVKVGVEKDNTVPVLEGLNPGEKVVTEGSLLLQALIDPAS
jgi:cobalt-zinc-cadmium efflux system membrane fusion protein